MVGVAKSVPKRPPPPQEFAGNISLISVKLSSQRGVGDEDWPLKGGLIQLSQVGDGAEEKVRG
jgi:hypothetical protein